MSTARGLERLVRENVLRITPYQAGKPIEEVERELRIGEIVKLASNENCLGPSPRALEAGRRALESGVHLYPDAASFHLRARLAELTGFPPEMVFVASGSTEILQLLAWALLEAGRSAVYADGSFIMYKVAVLAAGGSGIATPLDRDERHDLHAMRDAILPSTRLLFIANPNNPTGTYVSRAALQAFLGDLPPDVVVVIDEAYKEYVEAPDYPDALEELRRGARVIVLRTFSKVHGLAGMRMGYAVGPRELVGALHRVRSPFNVTSVGQAMALAALDDDAHQKRSRDHNRCELAFLAGELGRRALAFTPSVANFLLVDVGMDAERAFEAMLRSGVITRPMGGYGFATRLRVTVGLRTENERFLGALDRLPR